jgi:hypothetical protein
MSKLLLISNLLLGEKQVRASAPDSDSFLADSLADSGENSGETQWACLRHAHALARSEPLSSILVLYFKDSSNSFWLSACGGHRFSSRRNPIPILI